MRAGQCRLETRAWARSSCARCRRQRGQQIEYLWRQQLFANISTSKDNIICESLFFPPAQWAHTLSDLLATLSALFLDIQVSLSQAPIGRPTPVHPSVGWSNFQIYILSVSLRPHKASIRHYGGRHGCWHGSIDSTILCFSVFWIGKYMIKTEIQI